MGNHSRQGVQQDEPLLWSIRTSSQSGDREYSGKYRETSVVLCGSLPHLHLDLSEGGMQVGRCQDHQERRQEAETLTEPLKTPSRQCSHLLVNLEMFKT